MIEGVSTIFDYKVAVTLTIVLVVRTCNALAIGDKIVAQCVIHTIFAPHFDRLCTIILGIMSEPMQKHSISCNMREMRKARLFVVHLALLKRIHVAVKRILISRDGVFNSFPIVRAIFFRAHCHDLGKLKHEFGVNERELRLPRIVFRHY